MATDNEATDSVPTPQKRKPGRPKKVTTDTANIAELQRMVANLQDALLNRGSQEVERQKATLEAVPAPTEELRPGTYVSIGQDSSGAPILGKVSWTRAWIEKVYAPVTFTPNRSMDLGPHGIQYHVDADVETTVPSIVKSLYDDAIRSDKMIQSATKPLTAQEIADIDSRANEAPGTKQYSRLYRLAGGLNVRQDTPVEPTA